MDPKPRCNKKMVNNKTEGAIAPYLRGITNHEKLRKHFPSC